MECSVSIIILVYRVERYIERRIIRIWGLLLLEIQVVKGNHIGRAGIDIDSIPSKFLDNDTLLKLFYLGIIHYWIEKSRIR